MQKLWKASKLFKVPLSHPYISNLNAYDLLLIEWLEYFDNPENIDRYKKVIVDEDFEKYYENPDEWEEVEANEQ